jgi:nicotinate phosphoribosyltransferase
MNGLLTDLYELTMAAGYFEAGKAGEVATFECAVRRLPPNRNFVIAAGLPQVVEYLLNLSFSEEEIAYLKALPQFRSVSPAFSIVCEISASPAICLPYPRAPCCSPASP